MSRRNLQRKLQEEKQLYFAISNNDPAEVEKLIKNGLDVNKTFNGSNQWGKSALHLCCEKGQLECARVLVDAGALTDVQDEWYQTPLMYSVCTERPDMVSFLVNADCLMDTQDRFGKTALHFAIKNTELDCLNVLLDGGADVNSSDDTGRSPLWCAVTECGREKVITKLLETGADVNQRDWREKCTPLQASIMHLTSDTLRYVNMLLVNGAEVNTTDVCGRSPMTNLIYRSVGTSTRIQHIPDSDLDIARMLLSHGYDVNLCVPPVYSNRYHGTALKAASQRGALPYLSLLLEARADPDIRDLNQATPLMYAALNGHLDVVKMLIVKGNCDIDLVGTAVVDGEHVSATALRLSLLRRHWDVAGLLVAADCDTSQESFLLTNDDVPLPLVENVDLWCSLRDKAATPLSLAVLCRKRIRATLQRNIITKTQALPLPPRLQAYLAFDSLRTYGLGE